MLSRTYIRKDKSQVSAAKDPLPVMLHANAGRAFTVILFFGGYDWFLVL